MQVAAWDEFLTAEFAVPFDTFCEFEGKVAFEDTDKLFWGRFPFRIHTKNNIKSAADYFGSIGPDDIFNVRVVGTHHRFYFVEETAALNFIRNNIDDIAVVAMPSCPKALEVLLANPEGKIQDEYFFYEYPWKVTLRDIFGSDLEEIIEKTFVDRYSADNPEAPVFFSRGSETAFYARDFGDVFMLKLAASEHVKAVTQVILKREIV